MVSLPNCISGGSGADIYMTASGYSEVAIDTFSFASDISWGREVNHSLGKFPKAFMIYANSTPTIQGYSTYLLDCTIDIGDTGQTLCTGMITGINVNGKRKAVAVYNGVNVGINSTTVKVSSGYGPNNTSFEMAGLFGAGVEYTLITFA